MCSTSGPRTTTACDVRACTASRATLAASFDASRVTAPSRVSRPAKVTRAYWPPGIGADSTSPCRSLTRSTGACLGPDVLSQRS